MIKNGSGLPMFAEQGPPMHTFQCFDFERYVTDLMRVRMAFAIESLALMFSQMHFAVKHAENTGGYKLSGNGVASEDVAALLTVYEAAIENASMLSTEGFVHVFETGRDQPVLFDHVYAALFVKAQRDGFK